MSDLITKSNSLRQYPLFYIKDEMCLRNIKHPNILECFGYSYVEGNFTVILQLSEDGSLDKVILFFF